MPGGAARGAGGRLDGAGRAHGSAGPSWVRQGRKGERRKGSSRTPRSAPSRVRIANGGEGGEHAGHHTRGAGLSSCTVGAGGGVVYRVTAEFDSPGTPAGHRIRSQQ